MKPILISLVCLSGFCAVIWSDGSHAETADFLSSSAAMRFFEHLTQDNPQAVRVINGTVQ